jgi:hypothetical protein
LGSTSAIPILGRKQGLEPGGAQAGTAHAEGADAGADLPEFVEGPRGVEVRARLGGDDEDLVRQDAGL